ncbi:DUF5000 domain-containing lipoprotein [Parabacteroides bouchesdurhonensis]|uniref:DUF5000 domain-containing lipoprotein n=1 Tax=Parabacteroides bouchesdurhonensis TaxID=1936995 RepID=UPI00164D4DA6|nr:DUF5000 domain-containing lipoprotein [Parabacteroides bouchesdurhonensis]
MKKIIILSGAILCTLLNLTSCHEDGLDDSIPLNPVMTPIKSVTAQDGDETVAAVITDKNKTIELSLKNLTSLSNVDIHLSISKRAKLVSPADSILTVDLTQPYEIVVNNLIKDVTYTLTASIPEFVQIDNTKHKAYLLSNDSRALEGDINKLWDGKRMSKPEAYDEVNYGNYLCGTDDGPSSFTFDIGESIHLYRFRASLYWAYTNVCPKRYELWGYLGESEPSKSGDWSEWTKLGDIDNSESLLADFGEGDNIYIEKENSPKVRYLRLRCLENYRGDNSSSFSLCEVTVWAYNM